MGVIQYPRPIPVTNGTLPSLRFMVSTDNLATMTTAGYLNSANTESATPLSQGDVVMALYSYNVQTLAGTFGIFTVSINSTTGITLVEWTGTSGVTLPTIANHIATYTNTTGGLSEDPATAISGGNIQAGLSGTAGTLASFPATASKGSLVVKAVANTGNTNTTISNDAMGQASVVNIPDPANAVAQFLVGATATPFVSGNFPKNSGTAGLMVDSGVSVASISSAITQLGQLQQISVTLDAAQVITAYTVPQILIPAVAGKVAIVHSANVYTASTGNTPFATGTAPIIQYGSTIHGAGTIATDTGLVTGDIEAAASQIRTIGPAASTVYTGITNTEITFSCATAYTGGTGTTITFTLVYELITATV